MEYVLQQEGHEMKATCKDFIKFIAPHNSFSIRWHTFYLYSKIEAVSVSNE